MAWFVLRHLIWFLVDLLTVARRADHDKDLQILLLQHQVRLLQRQRPQPLRLTRWEKLTLAVLAARLARLSAGPRAQLDQVILLFKPETVLGWHRAAVRRKWTTVRHHRSGRPPIPGDLEALVLRLARENPGWGYSRLHGELTKLGYAVGRSTVRDVLKRHRVPPAPGRRRGSTWRAFLDRHKDRVLACDFFTVETLFLRTVYVLFFLELGTRRVHVAGCTTSPTAGWVTQQARQLCWKLQDGEVAARYLIRDRDAKYPPAFDAVFGSEGVEVVRTPYRAPTANAVAERWVGSVRRECLDHLLIVGEAHLRHVLAAYVGYYNRARPHQGLEQHVPMPTDQCGGGGPVRRRDLLGGLLRDYYRATG